jgi:hypothetical protein
MGEQATAANQDTTTANRGGQLTPEQQRRAIAEANAQALPGTLAGACFAFLFAVILWAGSRSYSSHMSLRDALLFAALILVSLLLMAAFLWRRARAVEEIRAGHLQRADGHIIWQNGAYRAEVPGHTLNLSAFNLAAGTYTFSFLPRSGRVVAAELVALDSPAQAQDALRHALAVTNHFNVDDLPAFREGRLGRAGSRRLRQVWMPTVWMLLVAFVLFVVFVVLVSAEASKDLASLAFIFSALAGIVGLFTALFALRPTFDLLGGKVYSAAGVIEKVTRRTTGRYASTFYYYRLDKHLWTVSPDAQRALIDGPAYRAYFLPRSQQLIGIEPM